jgi:hypothetical protein
VGKIMKQELKYKKQETRNKIKESKRKANKTSLINTEGINIENNQIYSREAP